MGLYEKLQATASKLIRTYGTTKLTVIGNGTSYTTSGVFAALSFMDRLNGNVAEGSQQVTLPGDVPIAPQVGFLLQRGDGIRFVITRVDVTDPAETPLLYNCVVNR